LRKTDENAAEPTRERIKRAAAWSANPERRGEWAMELERNG
jgi:hypothetical protein